MSLENDLLGQLVITKHEELSLDPLSLPQNLGMATCTGNPRTGLGVEIGTGAHWPTSPAYLTTFRLMRDPVLKNNMDSS